MGRHHTHGGTKQGFFTENPNTLLFVVTALYKLKHRHAYLYDCNEQFDFCHRMHGWLVHVFLIFNLSSLYTIIISYINVSGLPGYIEAYYENPFHWNNNSSETLGAWEKAFWKSIWNSGNSIAISNLLAFQLHERLIP